MQSTATTSDGPALDADLLAWLKASKGPVQLPIAVRHSVLGIEGGTVLGADLELRLDDTRMGIGLADRLRDVCPDDAPCNVWLEGEWGATLPRPGETEPTFSVREVVGPVEDEPTHARLPGA